MAERRLFGTDGVRGVAGELLTADLAVRLGRAATQHCAQAAPGREAEEAAPGVGRPQVLIVRDTRESGPMLESALAAGVAAGGGDALVAGVLPTPAASVLARRYGLDLAAVVSASHNPYRDNGIKFLSSEGTKLDDDAEAAIEARLAAPGREAEEAAPDSSSGAAIGRIRRLEGALDDYLRELESHFRLDLGGVRVLLDCANGATYRAAPAIFERLGAEVEAMAAEPDGRNINDGVGSTHVDALVERMKGSDAAIGFAFDGDGDRVLAVDRAGRVRDGDELIALAAEHLDRSGELDGGVAVTVMTNYGFHREMDKRGIEAAQTNVGDRYVLEALRERGWRLGGEQSGHIIWTDFTPTGDGIAAALLTLRALDGADLADVEPFERLPQRLENIEIADRSSVEDAASLWDAVDAENAKLDGRGRVLVRPSGTEPLLRVMVEAPDAEECDAVCDRLVALIGEKLA